MVLLGGMPTILFLGRGPFFSTDLSYSKFSLMCVLLHLSVTNLPFDEGHRITCVYIHMNIYISTFLAPFWLDLGSILIPFVTI